MSSVRSPWPVVEFTLLRPLDGDEKWSKIYRGVCHLAPRWCVNLEYSDGKVECVTATYMSSGMQRDAFVLDDCRVLKLSPNYKKFGDQNKKESDTHAHMNAVAGKTCVPAVFGVGLVRVGGYEYSWIIVERARGTLSDLMIHSEAFAHTGDDSPVQRFACSVTRTRACS